MLWLVGLDIAQHLYATPRCPPPCTDHATHCQVTCFAGAQHLGGGVLSRSVPRAKSNLHTRESVLVHYQVHFSRTPRHMSHSTSSSQSHPTPMQCPIP